jgi:ferritin-like metal-binding protein YciE
MAKSKLNSLQDLFEHELQDLYDAEHQLTEALPKMAKGASSRELKTAFDEHLSQTKNQIKRLEHVFAAFEMVPKRKTCEAMKGLLKEGSQMLEEEAEPVVKDAGLIAAAQRVEHDEMAGYGTLRSMAYQLGHQDAAQLLQETLDEEEATDKRLSQLANGINEKAVG